MNDSHLQQYHRYNAQQYRQQFRHHITLPVSPIYQNQDKQRQINGTTYNLIEDPAVSLSLDLIVKYYEMNQSISEASEQIEEALTLIYRFVKIGMFHNN